MTAQQYKNRKAAVRQEAMDWLDDFNNHNYSFGELVGFQVYFERLGREYGLIQEFQEVGIC